MAIIAQKQLFGWEEIAELGDLERLRLVLEYVPDEPLMRLLEQLRGKGRDDYPVRAMWNSLLAGVVFQHCSVASLRRELKRNGQLRQLCGFDVLRGVAGVPSGWAYSRFLQSLMRQQERMEAIFEALVEALREVLPGFGRTLGMDSKGIGSHAQPRREEATREPDGRRDGDADWGVKTYRGQREDGTLWEKVKRWFGYKLHLLVDADYELPVAFEVTKASAADAPQGHALVERLAERHEALVQESEYLVADKGYDDGKLIERVWDEHEIKPVIAIRDCWQESEDGQGTRRVGGTENVVYDSQGNVCCVCLRTGQVRGMAYGGFEKARQTLKYRCPAKHYDLECQGREVCPITDAIRIPLDEERRVFTPLARSSYAWKRIYQKRTAVERVNSRLDVSFGFEHHFIRGQKKMKLQCTLALVVMLTMALGRVQEKQQEHLRSLVKAAA